jgi:hypothetical protein
MMSDWHDDWAAWVEEMGEPLAADTLDALLDGGGPSGELLGSMSLGETTAVVAGDWVVVATSMPKTIATEITKVWDHVIEAQCQECFQGFAMFIQAVMSAIKEVEHDKPTSGDESEEGQEES